MADQERKFFVPLGDKNHPHLERAAFGEAWELSHKIIEEEYSQGKIFVGGIESLQRLSFINPIYYFKKGILSIGGYLVTIEEKTPRKDFKK